MINYPVLKEKKYAHFDPKHSAKGVEPYILNPEKVAHHAFMPLIHFTQKNRKFSGNKRKVKKRDLFYTAHMDSYIYQLYSYYINEMYNDYAKKNGTNKCALAYRNNMKGKCNIHFAREVFDFIKSTTSCYIIVGDFTGFFDNLDHECLKSKLAKVMGLNETTFLPDDYWNILKNLTQYSWFELSDILALTDKKNHKELNAEEIIFSIDEFRSHKTKHLKKNFHSYGIPQGTAISATLSNIYMIDFDKSINDFVTTNNGLYRRYSDDFIIVLPINVNIKNAWEKIYEICKLTKRLTLQREKTKIFQYKDNTLKNLNEILDCPKTKSELDYLGFTFDGRYIRIRDKTTSKYYYRTYRRIDTINIRIQKHGKKHPDFFGLFGKYTYLGEHEGQGNFIKYARTCLSVFPDEPQIQRFLRRHYPKIQARLKTSAVSGK